MGSPFDEIPAATAAAAAVYVFYCHHSCLLLLSSSFFFLRVICAHIEGACSLKIPYGTISVNMNSIIIIDEIL